MPPQCPRAGPPLLAHCVVWISHWRGHTPAWEKIGGWWREYHGIEPPGTSKYLVRIEIRHRGVLGLLHFFMASWSKIIVLKHHLFLGGQHWFRFEAKMFDLWQSDRPIRGQTGEHMAFFFWVNLGRTNPKYWRERERDRERGGDNRQIIQHCYGKSTNMFDR